MARFRPLAVLFLGILLGGAPGPVLAQPAPTGGTLTVQTTAEPPGLDLTATPASATATVVFYNVQEALVKVDEEGKLVPWLAPGRSAPPWTCRRSTG